MPALTLQDILQRIASARASLFERYPIKRLGIFGSYVRGDQQPDSDIDFVVEFSEPVGFEIVDLALELETLLEHNVDLVSRKAIRDRLLPYVEKHLVYV